MKPLDSIVMSARLRRVFTIVAAVIALSLMSVMLLQSRDESYQQDRKKLIKFSHKLHVKDQGVACTDCHEAGTSKLSSDNLLPKQAVCQTCHDEQLQNNCTYCHLSNDKATYVPFESPKRSVIFSHELHVTGQKVECAKCHGGIEETETPSSGKLPTMATCTTCHNGAKAVTHCETCHTDLAALRPKEHNDKDFVKEHRRIARLSDASCMNCHSQESCIDCHNGGSLQKTSSTGRDMTSSHSPRLIAIDRGQGQALTKVHDLNFKYTHGIAAKGKSMECQTCHDEQDFCATCHGAGGNVNQVEFMPASHGQVGFVTLGVGSGGGLHATLARRDIESCAACHDAQGADPTCTNCHVDPDGVRGTNPKTHPSGFMHDVSGGNWHTDPGATCYVCHTDSNARPGGVKGQKFCGYCHS